MHRCQQRAWISFKHHKIHAVVSGVEAVVGSMTGRKGKSLGSTTTNYYFCIRCTASPPTNKYVLKRQFICQAARQGHILLSGSDPPEPVTLKGHVSPLCAQFLQETTVQWINDGIHPRFSRSESVLNGATFALMEPAVQHNHSGLGPSRSSPNKEPITGC